MATIAFVISTWAVQCHRLSTVLILHLGTGPHSWTHYVSSTNGPHQPCGRGLKMAVAYITYRPSKWQLLRVLPMTWNYVVSSCHEYCWMLEKENPKNSQDSTVSAAMKRPCYTCKNHCLGATLSHINHYQSCLFPPCYFAVRNANKCWEVQDVPGQKIVNVRCLQQWAHDWCRFFCDKIAPQGEYSF